jgi:C-terminal processing protease CtpA/Prc
MELTGARPDIYVPRLPHHHVNKLDPQLEKAIEVILGKVGNKD